MKTDIFRWVNYKYPQNYIIKNHYTGSLIIALFCFAFLTAYKPLNAHAGRSMTFEATMAFYSLLSGISVIFFVKILKAFRYFSEKSEWILLKELLAVFIIISGIGITIYFIGFLIEPSGPRWNFPTFLDSVKSAFLLAIIPFTFFTAINYKFLYPKILMEADEFPVRPDSLSQLPEELVQISSQLKKETLSFYPSEFVFAESDGNYVVFYLKRDNIIRKEIIRNSVNNIEQQLSVLPFFLRTHRAFIVNMKKVRSRNGNTLGYQLRLSEPEFIVPVSRNKTRVFDELFKQFHA